MNCTSGANVMISIDKRNRQLDRRMYALAGMLVDERIQKAELGELQSLLADDGEARRTYVEAMMLQADLRQTFGQERRA
jgi:hypothetical protein